MDGQAKAPFIQLNAVDKLRYKNEMERYNNGEKFDRYRRGSKNKKVPEEMSPVNVPKPKGDGNVNLDLTFPSGVNLDVNV